jgi:hypothetical protein
MTFLEYYEDIRKKYDDDPIETSDKGIAHTYIESFYSNEFTPIRHNKITLVEVGVWRGKSLILFNDWFVNGNIIGIENLDFSHSTHFFNDVLIDMKNRNIKIITNDAYKKEVVDGFENESIDYLIEDGSHNIDEQVKCVELYYQKIKKGGKIIIEDVSDLDNNLQKFINLNIEYKLYDMRRNTENGKIAPHLHNNVLLIFEKK